jgi:glucose/arabinose dehydrogenase
MYVFTKKRLGPKTIWSKFLIGLWTIVTLFLFSQMQGCKKHVHEPGQDDDNKAIDLKLIAADLVSPVSVVQAPDESGRLYIVDQIGKIWILDKNGSKLPVPFFDISSKIVKLTPGYDERGLLSIAFHPDFKSNGKFFVFYTGLPSSGGPQPGVPWDNTTRISEFKIASGNPIKADMGSEHIILEVNHPEANHNGGTIAFGPDGFLYISIGDGGNKDDVGPGHVEDWYKVNKGGNGQDIYANLLGNVLRIDVNQSGKLAYGIPSDNPFVGTKALPEIYAYGFRNPFRFSFDMGGSHQLFLGDVGQSLYEEIDVVTRGGNYGWNVKEGTHCFSTDNDLIERSSCPMVDTAGKHLIDPVIELVNSANPDGGGIAIAVIGGNVYRGDRIESLEGKYVFGVLSADDTKATGKLYKATPDGAGLWPFKEIKLKSFPGNLGQYVKGFGQDQNGEMYVTTSNIVGPSGTTGKVYKLVKVDD